MGQPVVQEVFTTDEAIPNADKILTYLSNRIFVVVLRIVCFIDDVYVVKFLTIVWLLKLLIIKMSFCDSN